MRRKYIAQAKSLEKKIDFTVTQALSNFFTIKYFNAEKFELSRYKKLLEVMHNIGIKIIIFIESKHDAII